MSDLTTEDRLAALQARRRPRTKPERVAACAKVAAVDAIEPATPHRWPEPQHRSNQVAPVLMPTSTATADTMPVTFVQTLEPSPAANQLPAVSVRPREIPWERVTAAGASLVSFAAMIVAMGPIFKAAESSDIATTASDPNTPAGEAVADATAATPAAPAVDIQVTPPLDDAQTPVSVDESITPVSPDSTATAEATQTGTESGQTQTTPQPEAAPTAAEPATDATTAPATAPPTTAASQETVATTVETAPPTTAAPATAPPTTAPSDTPPPRSEGSG